MVTAVKDDKVFALLNKVDAAAAASRSPARKSFGRGSVESLFDMLSGNSHNTTQEMNNRPRSYLDRNMR